MRTRTYKWDAANYLRSEKARRGALAEAYATRDRAFIAQVRKLVVRSRTMGRRELAREPYKALQDLMCYDRAMNRTAKSLPKVSAAERGRRHLAAIKADGSLRLEGLAMSPAALAISAEWESGSISDDEMIAAIKALPESRG